MLGTGSPHSADKPPHTSRSGSRSVAVVTTEMMWAVALATTRASIASTARGLSLWSQMLRAPIAPWPLLASRFACSSDSALEASVAVPTGTGATAASDAPGHEATDNAMPADPADEQAAAFASYRSSGGHAAAQVITTPIEPVDSRA